MLFTNRHLYILHHFLNGAISGESHVYTTNYKTQGNKKNPDCQNFTKLLNGSFCFPGRKKDKVADYKPKRSWN
jgi:hypothetical protein